MQWPKTTREIECEIRIHCNTLQTGMLFSVLFQKFLWNDIWSVKNDQLYPYIVMIGWISSI